MANTIDLPRGYFFYLTRYPRSWPEPPKTEPCLTMESEPPYRISWGVARRLPIPYFRIILVMGRWGEEEHSLEEHPEVKNKEIQHQDADIITIADWTKPKKRNIPMSAYVEGREKYLREARP